QCAECHLLPVPHHRPSELLRHRRPGQRDGGEEEARRAAREEQEVTVESLERHSWNEQLVTFVDRYSAGRAAQAISHDDLPDLGAVVVLPTWTWGPARINVGAKDRGPNGEKLALPVPVTWQPSRVLVVPTGQQVEVACSIVGRGYTGRSSATVCAVPGIVSTETTMRTEGLPVPARVRQPVTTRRRIASRLDELV